MVKISLPRGYKQFLRSLETYKWRKTAKELGELVADLDNM